MITPAVFGAWIPISRLRNKNAWVGCFVTFAGSLFHKKTINLEMFRETSDTTQQHYVNMLVHYKPQLQAIITRHLHGKNHVTNE